MSQPGYYRYATIAADAIVFVCEDDLWTVPRGGGVARRLTASSGEVSTPRLSPDGSLVAFVGRDEGNPEVYVMPSGGGVPRRLTFLGSDACSISGWSPDGEHVLFASDAAWPFAKETRGYRISKDGGAPESLELGHLRTMSQHPDGRFVLGRNSDDPARWKRYKGGTAGDLWVDRDGNGTFSRLITLNGNPCWPMWIGERIAFLSDHEGIGNIYSVLPDGSDLRRHSNEADYFARFPSTDGTSIVYTAGAEICLLDPANDSVTRVAIDAVSPAAQTARRFVDVG